MHILRAAMGTACWYAIFLAITLIPLTNAMLLAYSAPLWMPLVAWVVTRKSIAGRDMDRRRPRLRRRGAGAPAGGHGYNLGDLSALAGALFLAVAMMSVRWLGCDRADQPHPVLLLPALVADDAADRGPGLAPVPLAAWPWIAALAAAQLASQVLIGVAYRYASAEKVGPFIYSVIVFTALIDWIVWHHRPDCWSSSAWRWSSAAGWSPCVRGAGARQSTPDPAPERCPAGASERQPRA